jgi:hypothetical protein
MWERTVQAESGAPRGGRFDKWWRRPLRGGNRRPFGNAKAIGGDAERGVVMKAAPATTFIVSKTEFLFDVLIVAFDAPTQLGEIH